MTENIPQAKPQLPDTPKRVCSISIMFPIENDEQALQLKQAIDQVIPDVPNKRYNFQIIET